ncbi:hypothetical protein OHA25_36145 [Nonomuraea sp. NBC_00507]|uniref:hypothetical protein n=1 Tax=Nonomuraea sp. NBC_00507 TaxID=2976002 RepID=UPI002E19A77E
MSDDKPEFGAAVLINDSVGTFGPRACGGRGRHSCATPVSARRFEAAFLSAGLAATAVLGAFRIHRMQAWRYRRYHTCLLP